MPPASIATTTWSGANTGSSHSSSCRFEYGPNSWRTTRRTSGHQRAQSNELVVEQRRQLDRARTVEPAPQSPLVERKRHRRQRVRVVARSGDAVSGGDRNRDRVRVRAELLLLATEQHW